MPTIGLIIARQSSEIIYPTVKCKKLADTLTRKFSNNQQKKIYLNDKCTSGILRVSRLFADKSTVVPVTANYYSIFSFNCGDKKQTIYNKMPYYSDNYYPQ